MSRLHPVLCGMVTSPGTANMRRLSSSAHPAVLSAPERARAWATMRLDDKAAIRRFLMRNRLASGAVPGHSSEISAPEWLMMVSKKAFVAFRPDMVEASGEYRDGAAGEGRPDFVHGLDGTPVGCRIGA